MEQQLVCALKLPLKEMAIRRVVVNVWNASDVLAAIEKFRFKSPTGYICEDVWREIVDKVKEKISKLMCPESLKKQMMHLVKPIGSDIIRWKLFHEYILEDSREYLDIHILEQLRWSCTGAIDYQKTAEQLVRHQALNNVKCYKLASLYCLTEFIPGLFEKVPESYKRSLYEEEDPFQVKVTLMENYWACTLTGDESKMEFLFSRPFLFMASLQQLGFEYAARIGSKAATEYFYHQLTDEERDSTIYRTCGAVISESSNLYVMPYNFKKEKLSDVFWYLLSLMNAEQQMQILKEHTCDVLTSFLDWPWQDLLLNSAHVIWTFLPERSYKYLLYNIIENIRNLGYYFPNLFQKFFISSPSDFRKRFLDRECRFCSFFSEFFEAEDSETIEVIFRNVDSADRTRLISCHRFFKLLDDVMVRDKWHLVEMCLREATPTKEDRIKLKSTYMRFLTWTDADQLESRERRWKQFFELLGDTDTSADSKTSSEDEALTKNSPKGETPTKKTSLVKEKRT
ncbi:uncharacterized protein LOC129957535 [Argiope bruennichi]|uniref:Uncharacterized protein n=1 Tax=Argiope bruennichi TaxID=94029 RepID=A0A8T0FDU9_ARGBR|nr:uncharacterized protein LOC129957535 [Argiope bruennichi]XP_055925859.1 uncharacterized protein LOC129957535 [Argiope bruennichi]KAF8789464.1 hypothetical protein HNY73_007401 [Argiope bruennichi]